MCMNQTGIDMEPHVEAAIEAFRNGNPVCLFDAENREGKQICYSPANLLKHQQCANCDLIVGGYSS